MSQPSPNLPAIAYVPFQPALGAADTSTQPALPASAVLPPLHQAGLLPVNNHVVLLLAAPPVNNVVVQPAVLELPVNMHDMVWKEDDQKALSRPNKMVHIPLPWRIQHASGG